MKAGRVPNAVTAGPGEKLAYGVEYSKLLVLLVILEIIDHQTLNFAEQKRDCPYSAFKEFGIKEFSTCL